VPVYNVEKYVEQCLHSLLQQTLNNVELIVVIDGSTDNSEAIVRKLAGEPAIGNAFSDNELETSPCKKTAPLREKFANMTVIKTENHGLAAARNEGIRHASGEYVAFIDSDDWVETDMFEDMYGLAKTYDADIVACNFLFDCEDGPHDVQPGMQSKFITDMDDAIHDILLSRNMNNCAWNKLFRRSLFDNTAIRFTEGRYFEDLFPMLQWVSHSSRIYLTNKPYYHYRRIRNNSITGRFSRKHIGDYVYLVNVVHNWLISNDLLDKFRIEFSTCAFRIYNQLMFNVFFMNIKKRYPYYYHLTTALPVNRFFTRNTVLNTESNKFILISLLGQMNKCRAGRWISFCIMSFVCAILKKLRH
jgi:glycosyltransferase involved in cell wall biosynthesis